jgi:Mg/Co/Ni transporter MgtE
VSATPFYGAPIVPAPNQTLLRHHSETFGESPVYLNAASNRRFAVGFALVGIVAFGSLAGSMLPLLLKRIGFDPASASAPFVATLVDVTGLVIYFSVAFLVLHGTLP